MNDLEKKIGGIADLANLLYASYAARDFFAKVIPGFVAVVSSVYMLTELHINLSEIKDTPFMAWILAFGVFYATGFTIQRIGETFPNQKSPIIKLYGEGWDSKTNAEKVEEFYRKAPTMYHRAQRERYVVIKELYGNLSVALMIVLLEQVALSIQTITKTGWASIEFHMYVGIAALFASIIGLLAGNKKVCESEKKWIEQTIMKAGGNAFA